MTVFRSVGRWMKEKPGDGCGKGVSGTAEKKMNESVVFTLYGSLYRSPFILPNNFLTGCRILVYQKESGFERTDKIVSINR